MNSGQKKRVGGIRLQNKKIIFLAAAVIVIAVLICVSVFLYRKHQNEKQQLSQGIQYLTELESQDISTIQSSIETTRSALSLDLAETDEGAVWAEFADAVIMGDSRAVGFYYHEFLPEDQVLAKGGGKITDVPEYMEQLKVKNPARIFLCYGLNDIGIGLWPEATDYAVEYANQVQTLMESFPDSTIYVNSILPAIGVGLEADPDYPRVPEYNEALKAMCEENGFHYIDNTVLAGEHEDLYQEDGLHVEKEFYKYWAANMLSGVEEQ